jgi:hypothetical protein
MTNVLALVIEKVAVAFTGSPSESFEPTGVEKVMSEA